MALLEMKTKIALSTFCVQKELIDFTYSTASIDYYAFGRFGSAPVQYTRLLVRIFVELVV